MGLGPSVSPSICPLFPQDGWMDYFNIQYHIGNHGLQKDINYNLALNKVGVFLFGTVLRYYVLLMLVLVLLMNVKQHLAHCEIIVIMASFSHTFYGFFCNISGDRGLILFIFGVCVYSNQPQESNVMHVKHSMSLCQNVALMSIISQSWYVCRDTSEINQCILFLLDTVIRHHSSLMYIKHPLALCQTKVVIPILS